MIKGLRRSKSSHSEQGDILWCVRDRQMLVSVEGHDTIGRENGQEDHTACSRLGSN